MKRLALVFLAAAAATVACDTESGPEPTECAVWLECYANCRNEMELPLDADAPPDTPLQAAPERNACVDVCLDVGRRPTWLRLESFEMGGEHPFQNIGPCLSGEFEGS